MSELQCLDTIKNRRRVSSWRSVEASATAVGTQHLPRKKKASKDRLYEIEIIEEEGTQVKVHYTGYSSEYDEWKEKNDVVFSKPVFPPTNTEQPISPLTELACTIKKKLLPSRSEDPEVRIQLPCDSSSFQLIRDRGILISGPPDNGKYSIRSYRDLEDVLGDNWHYRISNPIGDFSYVILETLTLHMCKSRPILEYEAEQDADGSTLRFHPVFIEQSSSIVVNFVRGDSNQKKLKELNFYRH